MCAQNGFAAQEHILVHDNTSMRTHGENSDSQIISNSVGIDNLTLPAQNL